MTLSANDINMIRFMREMQARDVDRIEGEVTLQEAAYHDPGDAKLVHLLFNEITPKATLLLEACPIFIVDNIQEVNYPDGDMGLTLFKQKRAFNWSPHEMLKGYVKEKTIGRDFQFGKVVITPGVVEISLKDQEIFDPEITISLTQYLPKDPAVSTPRYFQVGNLVASYSGEVESPDVEKLLTDGDYFAYYDSAFGWNKRIPSGHMVKPEETDFTIIRNATLLDTFETRLVLSFISALDSHDLEGAAAYFNQRDCHGATRLMVFVSQKIVDVKMLMKAIDQSVAASAPPGAINNHGNNLLMYLARYGQKKILPVVQHLFSLNDGLPPEQQFDVLAKNQDGLTAADIARAHASRPVFELIHAETMHAAALGATTQHPTSTSPRMRF